MMREQAADWLGALAEFIRPSPIVKDPYACEMCGVYGTGGCSLCGSGACDNGCRSPQSDHIGSENAVGEEGRCGECGAHPYVWTWYGGVALGTVGPPKRPWRARWGWKARVGKEIITGPVA